MQKEKLVNGGEGIDQATKLKTLEKNGFGANSSRKDAIPHVSIIGRAGEKGSISPETMAILRSF